MHHSAYKWQVNLHLSPVTAKSRCMFCMRVFLDPSAQLFTRIQSITLGSSLPRTSCVTSSGWMRKRGFSRLYPADFTNGFQDAENTVVEDLR
ncbi:hypothetical protein FKM82_017900 [Ascaphus truei]